VLWRLPCVGGERGVCLGSLRARPCLHGPFVLYGVVVALLRPACTIKAFWCLLQGRSSCLPRSEAYPGLARVW
jgi:hypothetical protein